MRPYTLEACVDSLESAVKAESCGADQLELCVDLAEDGLSPPFSLIEEVQNNTDIPIKVMVRLRRGNFIYSHEEISEMIAYAKCCLEMGIESFVTGMLTDDNHIHLSHLEAFAEAIPQASITFHKAIDLVSDPINQITRCQSITNLKYILTSGGQPTALQGINQLANMIKELEPRFNIIPAGKISQFNLSKIHKAIEAKYYHGRKIVE